MAERIVSIGIVWSEPDEKTGVRTFLGVQPVTRNDDGSDPESVFVPASDMNPQIVAAFQTTTFPALIAARAAVIAARMTPVQLAAKQAEDAAAAKALLDQQIAVAQASLAAKQEAATQLDASLAAKQAAAADLDRQLAEKQAALAMPSPEPVQAEVSEPVQAEVAEPAPMPAT